MTLSKLFDLLPVGSTVMAELGCTVYKLATAIFTRLVPILLATAGTGGPALMHLLCLNTASQN